MSFSSLPIRVRNALEQANIKTPEELAQRSRLDLYKTKNIGSKSIAVLEAFLSSRGLALSADGHPAGPVPEWLLSYERRAKEAGFRVERKVRGTGVGWWLNVAPGDAWGGAIDVFGPVDFILSARIQCRAPRELMAQTQVLIDALEIVAPEIVEHFSPKAEAMQ